MVLAETLVVSVCRVWILSGHCSSVSLRDNRLWEHLFLLLFLDRVHCLGLSALVLEVQRSFLAKTDRDESHRTRPLQSLFCLLFIARSPGQNPGSPFTYFALFSLILPFALPTAMDNPRLHQAQLAMAQAAQEEQERIRLELHDTILNTLATIKLTIDRVFTLLHPREHASVRERLQAIRTLVAETSQQLQDFLWGTDEDHDTWEALCSYLHRCGQELVEPQEIAFEFHLSPSLDTAPPPSPRLRVCLSQVFREAMLNVLKHSRATQVNVSFRWSGEVVIYEIQDNGIGFDMEEEAEGHYGLPNMRRRVEKCGGVFLLKTGPGEGTHIPLHLSTG